MNFFIKYKVGHKTYINESAFLKIKVESDYKVSIIPSKPIKIIEAKITYPYDKKGLLYCNGFQTWTDSGLYRYGEKMPHNKPLAYLMDFFIKTSTVGDVKWVRQDKLYSHTYTYIQKDSLYEFFGALNERTGFTTFHFKNELEVYKDMEGTIIQNPFVVFDLFHMKGGLDACLDKYFDLLNIPKTTAPLLDGYTSWYNHYQNITEEKLLSDLEGMKKISWFHPKLFQLDDGYETFVGDWLDIDKKKFPNGLEKSVEKIKKAGMIPGIWIAPFICEKKSRIRKEHPEWILCRGALNWSTIYHLDITRKDVKDYLHKVFQYYIKLGFRFFKLDFLYSAAYEPLNGKTRSEIMYEAMDFVREELKGCYILGCGVPLSSAFGKVDYCRIGCDVTLNDNGPWYFSLLHRERLSTIMAIKDTKARAHLNGRPFNNDPDVFILRDTPMTPKLKEELFNTNLRYGNLLLTSDDISKYSEDDLNKLRLIQEKVEKNIK